ncbi:MAG: protein translocase subunit SecF [Chitinispirillaceae bacterium]|nr:protein translocase subunit SecF [Chitinispirillaceae bacterium]
MIEFVKNSRINFIGAWRIAVICSLLAILAGIGSVAVHRGFNFSIDFVGGTLTQLKFQKSIQGDIAEIRSIIAELGYGSPEVKTIGQAANNEIQVMVRKKAEGTLVVDGIKRALQEKYAGNPFEVRRVENVGPKIGGELRRNAIIASLLSLLAILIYVGFRFNLPFGVAAVIPLFHDTLITLSVFSLLNREISLTFLAALLTIIGYSLNDTIVIFDRIRENIRGGLRGRKFDEIINTSINQTFSRTVITTTTTLFVVIALFVLGSEAIKDFALALLVGMSVGTYSSIYIASPVLIWWQKRWPVVK